jgi:Mrp family chromosome partitioning ATPase
VPIVGEGKTTVTLGLARALVDLGFRVLVVDGDFRQAGLSRCLGYTQDLSIVEQPVRLQQNLDLVPTLPKQGKIVEMVTRGQFKQSLAAAQSAKNYDYVLIDSAPVSQTSETALMTAIIPNVLFIVRSGVSDRDSVTHSLNQLAQHNAKIVGLVVNGLETRARSYPYHAHSSLVKS